MYKYGNNVVVLVFFFGWMLKRYLLLIEITNAGILNDQKSEKKRSDFQRLRWMISQWNVIFSYKLQLFDEDSVRKYGQIQNKTW